MSPPKANEDTGFIYRYRRECNSETRIIRVDVQYNASLGIKIDFWYRSLALFVEEPMYVCTVCILQDMTGV